MWFLEITADAPDDITSDRCERYIPFLLGQMVSLTIGKGFPKVFLCGPPTMFYSSKVWHEDRLIISFTKVLAAQSAAIGMSFK